jgi:peptidoglycan-associated lipoprotein
MKTNISPLSCLLFGLILALSGCNSPMMTYKKGIRHFDAGEYNPALAEFQKVADKPAIDAARVNYYTAESYRLSNHIAEAAPFYKKAIDAGTTASGITDADVQLNYAYSLKAQGNYADALAQLQQYANTNPASKTNAERALREIETLKAIDIIGQKQAVYQLKNVGPLNTPGAEFAPVVRGEDLIFTASRKEIIYKNNGQGMLGLYKTKLNQKPDETGNNPQLFSQSVFSDNVNEGTPAFSKDGKAMVFARGNNGKRKGGLDVDLYLSRADDKGNWSEPLRLPVSDSTAWDGSPAFSADGRTLYFASNRAGGAGGIDLYRTNIDASGRFSRPVNMGRDINTPGDEMFPYVAPDAKLYFASDGHPGLGKLDVFVATRSQGVIRVENLGQPINSPADDFGLTFMQPGKGFMASNRAGGKGDDDIYFFDDNRKPTDSTAVVVKRDPPKPGDPANPNDPTTPSGGTPKTVRYFIAGTVSANEATPVLLDSASVKVYETATEQPIGEIVTGQPGAFGKYPLTPGKEYTILVQRPGYLTKREPFTMQGRSIPEIFLKKTETDTTFSVAVLLDREEVGRKFVLDNIYYDLDKFNIRPDAAAELDKLVTILQDNPTLRIELSSHTDVRSADAYNLRLSQNRARSAVDYIVSKGIDQTRLVARGYGETQLIVKNAVTEEEHQRNRRTEFKILGY